MTSKRMWAVLAIIAVAAGLAAPVQAGKYHKAEPAGVSRMVDKAVVYNLSAEHGRSDISQQVPLVEAPGFTTASPGVAVGYTYYDLQQLCTMGRMIEVGPHSFMAPATVHFGWMYSPDSIYGYRSLAYNAYNGAGAGFTGVTIISDPEDYAGYVNVDVAPDNRAVVGGHVDAQGWIDFNTRVYFDDCPACGDFNYYVSPPDSFYSYVPFGPQAVWPKFFLQYGTDTVLHVAAMNPDDDYMSLLYYRCVDPETNPTWNFPFRCVDTVLIAAQDITGQRNGDRVALTWFANLAYDGCDTCSGPSPYEGSGFELGDNDIYVQVSNNQGATWEPRVNVTECLMGEGGWKPFCESSALFDQDGFLHLVWISNWWWEDLEFDGICDCPGYDAVWTWDTRMFHWSEVFPYARTVTDHSYQPGECTPPMWASHISKPSLSECDDKLYCLFTQFNDIPNGIDDDCAARYTYFPYGAANGDLWVTGSMDGGICWSQQINITNSYTPNCAPGDCQNDYWPSMNRWGRPVRGDENWTGTVAAPDFGSTYDNFLDVQYVNDLDPGSPILDEGGFQYNPIKWFRMPCFDIAGWTNPIFTPPYIYSPIGIPAGVQVDTALTIENVGNIPLTYTVTVEEDNGPSGWLSVSGFSGLIPSGLDNREIGAVHLNNGGVIVDWGWYYGRLRFEGNWDDSPYLFEIALWVGDPPKPTEWDTVHTNCLALIAGSNGNLGRQGTGKVNMDYYDAGDCDTTATIYLYDGSPVVAWVDGEDTVVQCAVWGANYLSEQGFRPQTTGWEARSCWALSADIHESGTFTTVDSSIGLRKVILAPDDNCPFVIQHLRVWSYDGETHNGIAVGELIDWDVPWDFLPDDEDHDVYAVNTGGLDMTRMMVYQQGYESYADDEVYPYNCQFNNDRFAGQAFVAAYYNESMQPVPFMGAVVDLDETHATDGVQAGPVYQELTYAGFRGTDSVSDLHTLMGFHFDLSLGEGDVYEVVTILATVHEGSLSDLQAAVDAGKAWYNSNGGIEIFDDFDGNGRIDLCENCCYIRGDVNGDGRLDIMDLLSMVECMWIPIWPPCDYSCAEKWDIDGIGVFDAMDVVYLVDYFWGGGPPPPPCD